MRARNGDDGGSLGGAGVDVVDDDRTPRLESRVEQQLLPAIRGPIVAQQVLADMIVRGGEPLAEECRLPRAGEPDQDDALDFV